MKMRFLCVVAAVALLGACSEPEKAGGGGTTVTPPPPPPMTQVTPGSQADFVKNVGDRVFFDFDKYNLKPEGRDQLAKWGCLLEEVSE